MVGGKKSKKPSKRIPNHKKYRAVIKDSARATKLRRDKKRYPEKFRKRSTKDPGIPNSVPFKAAIIEEARENRELEVMYEKKTQHAFKLRKKNEKAAAINEQTSIASLVESARKRTLEFENKTAIKEATKEIFKDKSAKTYYKEFKKVVDAADVLLEVLDSRDPLGTRCLPMEELIVNNAGKRLVFILNKADLVPKENLEAWLKYLRREKPTIPFKATTQSQQHRLAQNKSSVTKSDHISSSNCIGANMLMQLMKNYCRNEGIKTAISVGVVGLPNVGKSSVINSLKRSRACHVGSTPGVTKALQEIVLDSKVRLLDSPGVILPGANVNNSNSCLRNAIKLENLDDYYGPVDAILKKSSKQQIMLHYNIPAFEDTTEFLAFMARKTGKLKKKGISDVEVAAKKVLQDWNSGRIKYYTRPPEIVEDETEVSSEIVSTLGKEFSLLEIEADEKLFMEDLPEHCVSDHMCVETSGPLTSVDDGEERSHMDIEDMNGDEDSDVENGMDDGLLENVEIDMSAPAEKKVAEPEKKKRWESKRSKVDLSKVSLRQLQKRISKKTTKERNRSDRRASEMVEAFEGVSRRNSYDFNEFFEKT